MKTIWCCWPMHPSSLMVWFRTATLLLYMKRWVHFTGTTSLTNFRIPPVFNGKICFHCWQTVSIRAIPAWSLAMWSKRSIGGGVGIWICSNNKLKNRWETVVLPFTNCSAIIAVHPTSFHSTTASLKRLQNGWHPTLVSRSWKKFIKTSSKLCLERKRVLLI